MLFLMAVVFGAVLLSASLSRCSFSEFVGKKRFAGTMFLASLGILAVLWIYQGYDSTTMRGVHCVSRFFLFCAFAQFSFHRAHIGTVFLILGVASNVFVVASNEFQMPVIHDIGVPLDYFYVLVSPETRFMILGDWIPINPGFASPGDIFVIIATYVMSIELWRR